MSEVALAFSAGWGSGINAWLVLLVLGIADRIGDVAGIPDQLGNPWVIGVAAVLYVVEFVADKVPWLDSAWDAASTLVRPVVGAVIAVLLAGGDASSIDTITMGLLGGGSALASHSVKAGTRLAVNTSPEPFTNVAVSGAEDLSVLGVVTLALAHPVAAAVIALVLLVCGAALVIALSSMIRRGYRRLRARSAAPPT